MGSNLGKLSVNDFFEENGLLIKTLLISMKNKLVIKENKWHI